MSDEPKPTSERARKRASGKNLREALIKRRETYFDLLVSGYSTEEIASHTKTSASAVSSRCRSGLGELDAPGNYARLQVARLIRRCAASTFRWRRVDLKAIAPFLKVMRELNLYHGVDVGRTPLVPPAAPPEIAPTAPSLTLTHSPGVALTEGSEDEKSCAKAQLSF